MTVHWKRILNGSRENKLAREREQRENDAARRKSAEETKIKTEYADAKTSIISQFNTHVSSIRTRVDNLLQEANTAHIESCNAVKQHSKSAKHRYFHEQKILDQNLTDDLKTTYLKIFHWYRNLAIDMEICNRIADKPYIAKLFIQGTFLLQELQVAHQELNKSIKCLLDLNQPKHKRMRAYALNQAWLDILCITQHKSKSWAKEHGILLEKLCFNPNYVKANNSPDSFATRWFQVATEYHSEQLTSIKALYKQSLSAVFDELMLDELEPCLQQFKNDLAEVKHTQQHLLTDYKTESNRCLHEYMQRRRDLKQYWGNCIAQHNSYVSDLQESRAELITKSDTERDNSLSSLDNNYKEQVKKINIWFKQECQTIDAWRTSTSKAYWQRRAMKIGNGVLAVAGALVTMGQSLWVSMLGEFIGYSITSSGLATGIGSLKNLTDGKDSIGIQMQASISLASRITPPSQSNPPDSNLQSYQAPDLPDIHATSTNNDRDSRVTQEATNIPSGNTDTTVNYSSSDSAYNLATQFLRPGMQTQTDVVVPYRQHTHFELVTGAVAQTVENATLNSTNKQGFFRNLSDSFNVFKDAFHYYRNGTEQDKLILKQAVLQGILSANIEKLSEDAILMSSLKSVARGSRNIRDSVAHSVAHPIDTLYSMTVDPAMFAWNMRNSSYRQNVYQSLQNSIAGMDWMDLLEHGTSFTVGAMFTPALANGAVSSARALGGIGQKSMQFASQFNYRSPIVFKFESGRLNSGIPVDQIMLRNPVAKHIHENNSSSFIFSAKSNVDFMPKGYLDGQLYPKDKLMSLANHLHNRGVNIVPTNGNPGFQAKNLSTGKPTIHLPENPTVLQVKHELSHWIDCKNLGVERYSKLTRLEKEQMVLDRLKGNKIWKQVLNEQEKVFSKKYVQGLQNEAKLQNKLGKPDVK